MSRWDIKLEEENGQYQAIATPKVDELHKFVITAGRELTEKIMEQEEKLVLQTISVGGLNRLIELCQAELARRKK